MTEFIVRFLICNIAICILIGILLLCRHICKHVLTGRMQYHLWFLLLGLLLIPFLPVPLFGFRPSFSWIWFVQTRFLQTIFLHTGFSPSGSDAGTTISPNTSALTPKGAADWMNDFALSVHREMPSSFSLILCGIWLLGIFAMLFLIIRSWLRLTIIRNSALPLQHEETRMLYAECLAELKITKQIPIFSTAFLKSPMIVGWRKPQIYLPIHLISDYDAAHLRYMLYHELQHYKHQDALVNHFINLAAVFYWFNPLVWYALKKMRDDREIACDSSVLAMLKESEYEMYGHTLIHFAEKMSLTPFPFATGISGTMKQMERRISNISTYKNPSIRKKLTGTASFVIIFALVSGLAPTLSTYAANGDRYNWNTSSRNISALDLSSYFDEYEGSFVLYTTANDTWNVYDLDQATIRTSPDSTYKIYDALFGLEEHIITPASSQIRWNHEHYPYEEWNADQTLTSAMQASVNWYFQSIDRQLGAAAIDNYIEKINYGNENITGGLSSYWMESSLTISPVEQVELLKKLFQEGLGFAPEHISAVKDSILLSSSEYGNVYGKTGTGRIDGKDVNGWFVGAIETSGSTCFFATNIRASRDAAGSRAREITMSVLSDLGIWDHPLF